jgi:hypothetical protein
MERAENSTPEIELSAGIPTRPLDAPHHRKKHGFPVEGM